jgi:BTB/POZ domain
MSEMIRVRFVEKQYKFPCALLTMHPDSRLSKLASEQLHSNPEKIAVLKNGNSVLFKLVLDYLKGEGCVTLPTTVTRSAFLAELTFYGIEDVDELKRVHDLTSASQSQAQFREYMIDEINSWDDDVAVITLVKKCALLHIRSAGELEVTIQHDPLRDETFTCSVKKWKRLYSILHLRKMEMFDLTLAECNTYLRYIGLKVINVKTFPQLRTMTVTMEYIIKSADKQNDKFAFSFETK